MPCSRSRAAKQSVTRVNPLQRQPLVHTEHRAIAHSQAARAVASTARVPHPAPHAHDAWFRNHPLVRQALAAPPFDRRATIDRATLFHARLGLAAIICIPVRDEAQRIARCLAALARSIAAFGEPCGVVLIVNNTSDRSAEIACSWARGAGLPFLCCEATLEPAIADAGHARRIAFDVAAGVARVDAVLLTTDGDTCVADGWVAAMVRAVRGGSALAYGPLDPLPDEYAALPERVRDLDRTERTLFDVQQTLWELINPNAAPALGLRVGGANMAVSAAAYCRIGRLPTVASGEDRALARLMLRNDETIAYTRDAKIATSCRMAPRAAGGMGDALAGRAMGDMRCDADLLPTRDFVLRALLWRHLASPDPSSVRNRTTAVANRLGISAAQVAFRANEGPGARWVRLMALAVAPERLDHARACYELAIARRLAATPARLAKIGANATAGARSEAAI